MKEVWNEVVDCGVYANVNGVMTEICPCSSVQQAREFVHNNWVEGEGMYVEIINNLTGEILCYFEDSEPKSENALYDTIEGAFNELWHYWADEEEGE